MVKNLSLRVSRVHACFDQSKIFAFVEPFLHAEITKQQLQEIWKEAAKQLGETRPEKCRCSYRVTSAEAEVLVKNGIADFLITDWRYNADKKVYFPAPNPNLVWGGKKAEDLGLIRSSLAAKTPRVMTIEKANLERAYVGTARHPEGDPDEQIRIEIWGELARGVIFDLTVATPADFVDHTEGKPVISIAPGWDPRTCPGKTVTK